MFFNADELQLLSLFYIIKLYHVDIIIAVFIKICMIYLTCCK